MEKSRVSSAATRELQNPPFAAILGAGVWRYYRDKTRHGYGGNWRGMAGFLFFFLPVWFLTVRRETIGRRGMGQNKETFVLFYVFSGRIQSGRYVKGVCE